MSIRHLIGESFLDYFHFDSKFFRTILPLIFKPGFLTREFMKGKRKSYLEPFRLFLVISIIYFLLLPYSGDSTYDQGKIDQPGNSHAPGNSHNTKPLKYTIQGLSLSETGKDSIRREIDSTGLKKYIDKHYAKEGWAIKLLLKQAFKILVYSGQSFFTVLEHTASKMIFLLIPFFALLMKLFFLKSKRIYFEHLVFSLHTHSFIFLVLTVGLLIDFLIPVSMFLLIMIALVYLFFAIKNNYGESIGRTFWKFFLLMFFYCIIALPVFFVLLILVSIFLV